MSTARFTFAIYDLSPDGISSFAEKNYLTTLFLPVVLMALRRLSLSYREPFLARRGLVLHRFSIQQEIPSKSNSRIKVHLNFRDQSGSAGSGKSSDSFNALFGLRLGLCSPPYDGYVLKAEGGMNVPIPARTAGYAAFR